MNRKNVTDVQITSQSIFRLAGFVENDKFFLMRVSIRAFGCITNPRTSLYHELCEYGFEVFKHGEDSLT